MTMSIDSQLEEIIREAVGYVPRGDQSFDTFIDSLKMAVLIIELKNKLALEFSYKEILEIKNLNTLKSVVESKVSRT